MNYEFDTIIDAKIYILIAIFFQILHFQNFTALATVKLVSYTVTVVLRLSLKFSILYKQNVRNKNFRISLNISQIKKHYFRTGCIILVKKI